MYIHQNAGSRFNFDQCLVLGNFRRMKDAKACEAANPGSKTNGYLHGKYMRGWIVFIMDKPMTKEQYDQRMAVTSTPA